MTSELSAKSGALLNDQQQLMLHQLQLTQWLEGRRQTVLRKEQPKAEVQEDRQPVPDRWALTKGINLYSWQNDCVRSWFDAGCRGTVKVVTGGGKTVLALAIAEQLQNTKDRDLRVAIVVPTIVLMNQWYEEFEQRSNLPMWAVGRLGGGFSDSFESGQTVLISVLASAYKLLPSLVNPRIGEHLLFIADECHRAGATEMSKVLAVPRAYSLGLSATPERDDDEDEEGAEAVAYGETQLGRALGDVVYDLTLAQAVELGVVPKFAIRHYGLPLGGEEAQKYDRLTRGIEDSRKELQNSASSGRGSGLAFYRWVRSVSKKRGSRTNILAGRFLMDTRERKELLYRMRSRHAAVEGLLKHEFKNQPRSRAILFHESIDSVMELFENLCRTGFAVVAEHSDLPDGLREQSLELFRRGIANVIVSAKSLIEGFNVPAADVGIIVASSTSVRQRIQSLGRVLRKHRGLSGEEKTSIIHVLYARNTVDDAIYAKTDWEQFTGADRNEYFVWDPPDDPVQQEGPPRIPLPRDLEIDASELRPGDEYKGQYEGSEYSCDMQSNIRDAHGRYAKNPGGVPSNVRSVKGTAGRFRVTPNRHYVLVRIPEGDDWTTRFVMVLDVPFEFREGGESGSKLDWSEHENWLKQASVGQEYPFPQTNGSQKLNFRQRRGGVIAKRIPNGELYARAGNDATDRMKGEDARRLIEACRHLQVRGLFSSQFEINSVNDAVFRSGGKLLYLAHLESGLEFPRGQED